MADDDRWLPVILVILVNDNHEQTIVSLSVSIPVTEPVEKKRVKQGSFSAVLDNGIHLSYSFYGSTGECTGVTLGAHKPFSVCESLICI